MLLYKGLLDKDLSNELKVKEACVLPVELVRK